MATFRRAKLRSFALLAVGLLAFSTRASAQEGMVQPQRYGDAPGLVAPPPVTTNATTTVVVPSTEYRLAEPMQPATGNKLSGHVGLGTIFVVAGKGGTDVIGRDVSILGIVAGINLGINAHWSIDFEFILNSDFHNTEDGKSNTFFILDPGVVYNWGPLWTGLRIAARVPSPLGAEFGFIPIIGAKTKNHGPVHYYVELDLPMFIGSPAGFQFVTYLQTGVAF